MSATIQSAQATQPVFTPKAVPRQRTAAKSLRLPITVAALSALQAAGLGAAAWQQLKQQEAKLAQAKIAKADAQARLAIATTDLAALKIAQPSYANLRAKGVFLPESRLSLIDTLNALKQQHQLAQLEYTIEPQRTLSLAEGRTYAAIELLASRVNFTARSDHDGQLLSFINAFADLNRGIFPLQQCRIARSTPPPRARFGSSNLSTATTAENVGSYDAQTSLSASCALDWITLRDKSAAETGRTANTAPAAGTAAAAGVAAR